MATRFDKATEIRQVDSHTYSAHFPDEWCIGTVPNGGFITSCFMLVASKHFSTTLAKQNQPHTMTLHLEFMRRTQKGPATFKVKDMKLGRQASVIHVSLVQDGREEVVGYLSNTNMHTEEGASFPTDWEMHPPPLPADHSKFEKDEDPHWIEQKRMPFAGFRKSSTRMKWFFPRKGQRLRSISDEWVRWSSGEKFSQESLGFVCDNFPLVVESYNKMTPARFWYPTLLLNLDVKKALPPDGVDYLFVRAQSKQIKNGRHDIEVTILDEQGDLVALSHHVVLVVDSSRNLAERRKQDASKL
ncbi:hypothetical protein NA57DRAFT_39122 [Rhizodiscina lignyota]|uniref:Thioesterase-like superfamily-domain-containing protein n=1 Tax=Rhizodiscina lignyota TaxID=1504668 RepID=A0A9P4IBM8_9PEZI|nr:hypothetical protein NA57DRAFT_39122 [Rhizodiscina lignyota]